MIEPTEVELGEILLVGLSTETTQAELTNTTPAIWQRAGELQLDKKIQHVKDPNVTLDCQFDWHTTDEWTYMLAVEVTMLGDLPRETVFHRVPASKWLVYQGRFRKSML
jgi:predicted transcriptional regulator YdeE